MAEAQLYGYLRYELLDSHSLALKKSPRRAIFAFKGRLKMSRNHRLSASPRYYYNPEYIPDSYPPHSYGDRSLEHRRRSKSRSFFAPDARMSLVRDRRYAQSYPTEQITINNRHAVADIASAVDQLPRATTMGMAMTMTIIVVTECMLGIRIWIWCQRRGIRIGIKVVVGAGCMTSMMR